MFKRIIAILIIISTITIMLSPVVQPQTPTYDIRVENPIVFLASDLQGNVTGPNGTFYNILLVNMTSNSMFVIDSGLINETGIKNFSRRMNEDYFPAGRYTLNLTVDQETVDIVQITLVYDEKFILMERIKDIVDEMTAVWHALQSMSQRLIAVEEQTSRMSVVVFLIMILTIIFFSCVIYFVIIRAFKAKAAYWARKSAYILRRMIGKDCDPVIWADLEQKPAPDETRPNLNPIPHILKMGDVDPALADEYMLDTFAAFGMASIMEGELSWWAKRRHKKQLNAKAEKQEG